MCLPNMLCNAYDDMIQFLVIVTSGMLQRANCRCFPPGGSHQLVNLYACSPFQMVMQKDKKIYPGSGKRKPYVQWGRRVCIILHLSACTGVNTSAYELGWSMEALLCVSVVLSRPLSRASPFIVPRRGLGYMYRCQSRGP